MNGEELKRRVREVASTAYMLKGGFITIGPGRQRCIDAAADAVLVLLSDVTREEIQAAGAAPGRTEPRL